MILLASDLVDRDLGLTIEELNRMYAGASFYDNLNSKRNERVGGKFERQLEENKLKKVFHEKSLKIVQMILRFVPASRGEITSLLTSMVL